MAEDAEKNDDNGEESEPEESGGRKTKLVILVLALIVAVLSYRNFWANDETECACQGYPVITGTNLNLRSEKGWTWTSQPAKVSVLFKVETEGIPIIDLSRKNFRLAEDGQFVSEYESHQAVLPREKKFASDILVLLDLSGSILEKDNIGHLKTALTRFVNLMMPEKGGEYFGTMGIFWFDGRPDLHELAEFTDDREDLVDAIDKIKRKMVEDDSTNLHGALVQAVATAVQRGRMASYVVVFTDGEDQAARLTEPEALDAVKKAPGHLRFHAIGFLRKSGRDAKTIRNKVKAMGRTHHTLISEFPDLEPKFADIAGKIKNDIKSYYLIEYCSPKRKGSHDLKIMVDYFKLKGAVKTCFCAEDFRGVCGEEQPADEKDE